MCSGLVLTDAQRGLGCMNTIRESALKADPGRKIPCRIEESNLCQYRARFLSPTLYKPSHVLPYSLRWTISKVYSMDGRVDM